MGAPCSLDLRERVVAATGLRRAGGCRPNQRRRMRNNRPIPPHLHAPGMGQGPQSRRLQSNLIESRFGEGNHLFRAGSFVRQCRSVGVKVGRSTRLVCRGSTQRELI